VVLGSLTPVERAELAAKLLSQAFSGLPLKFTQVQLASFHASASPGPVVNMHDQVCRRKKGASDEDPVLASFGSGSALEPQFTLMPPVPVYTGGTDTDVKPTVTVAVKPVGAAPAAAAPAAAAPSGKAAAVPVPRLRPAGGAAADPVPATPVPPKTATKLAAPKTAGPTVPKVNASATPGSAPVTIDPGRWPSDQ
jgi:hypothetical protein